MRGARLGGAVLVQASLRNADLRAAYLRVAKLDGADVRGADLRDTVGLTPAQIESARTDGDTRLPEDLMAGTDHGR